MTQDLDRLLQLMGGRRSVRRFLASPLEEPQIRRLLEAACSAPSASNRQPYRIMVVRQQETKQAMARSVAEVARHRLVEGEAFGVDLEKYVRNFLHFEHAPVVFVVLFRDASLGSLAAWPTSLDPIDRIRDSVSSAAAAILQLLLAAHAMGLGACWMTGPCIAERELLARLRTPAGWRLAALVPVGFTREQPPPPRRKRIEQIVLAEPDSDAVPGAE